MTTVTLTQPQKNKLYAKLKEHFPAAEALRLMQLKVKKGSTADIAGDTWSQKAFEIIEWAERNGYVAELLVTLAEARPRIADFTELVTQVGLRGATVGFANDGTARVLTADGLQRTIRDRLDLAASGSWYADYGRVMHQVCRIETPGRSGGTGVLVGPSAVLTAFHVVNGVHPESIHVVFDAFIEGKGRRVALGAGGVLSSADPSDEEVAGDTAASHPTADELDYALLELAEPVGDEGIGKTVDLQTEHTRGSLVLPKVAAQLADRDPIIILQHPHGAPQKLAIDTDSWIGSAHEGRRVQYKTNTDPGTSGAPVFDFHWNFVALHHYGSGDYGFNQGIPVGLIRAKIVADGAESMLAT